jgi:hypothetical protein
MPDPTPERRSNLVLRALIDEMLDRVRNLNRDSVRLTDTERTAAEAELEGVMAHVRRIAGRSPASQSGDQQP